MPRAPRRPLSLEEVITDYIATDAETWNVAKVDRAINQEQLAAYARLEPRSIMSNVASMCGFANSLRKGVTVNALLTTWGLAKDNYYRWLRKGQAPDAQDPYRVFAALCSTSLGQCRSELEEIYGQQAKANGQVMAKLLAARWRDDWATTDRLDIDAKVEHSAPTLDPVLQTALELLKQRNEGEQSA